MSEIVFTTLLLKKGTLIYLWHVVIFNGFVQVGRHLALWSSGLSSLCNDQTQTLWVILHRHDGANC